ncbi:DUF4352 domain-containing protein [Geodermatophilus obscurus]|uniref:DUF4352 domain-containing protein n=1 Tax=Geodermatophilus obscurus (strain ATCC 25078 / DSM 43160 / JCM 3152 / CCUG 61914 / KCC A-0152 / KCTC 9177 / NBRC 13315 / NRRL B-3577 / G-20) TaxID=526225 RepID=D2SBR1_GEOOG|nr:DUF4352 domain-containing protein [Geodermatophilus obscurus]ADB76168.1 conserved hypothetical protein [Geodermatophilus obscurus DSM 43160]
MSQPTPPAPPQFADPKSAKAQAKAEKAYRKASRPFFKKKRFILLAVIALILIIAIAQGGDDDSGSSSTSSGGGSSSGDIAKAVGLNQAVQDGKFEFTVTGVDCSKNTLGADPVSTQAAGVFCLVNVNVANIGDEAQTLDSTSQYGYDAAGKKFSTDTEAAFYLENGGDTLFEQLNPGTSVDGVLVFDVPAETQLTKLELHDSPFSGGVTVNLG